MVVYWSRYTSVPLRVLMTHTCSVVAVTLVAALLCTGAYPVAFAAEPLPAYAQGQPAYDPGQDNPGLNTPPQGMPGVGLAVPAKPTGPAPDAADPGIAGNLNLSMPDVTFRNLLTKLQAPAPTAARFAKSEFYARHDIFLYSIAASSRPGAAWFGSANKVSIVFDRCT